MTPKNPPERTPPDGIDWAAVLAEHRRWLRTVVQARVGEPQAVEEVLQEVSLAAVRQQAPLEDPTKLAPWLYRLAVTQSLLYRRKMGRRRRLASRYAEHVRATAAPSPTADPLGWLLADERRDMVRRAMRQLPARDAEILMLKYSEDWKYRQIASHLGMSESAVETRLHRARQRLREELAALDSTQTERSATRETRRSESG